MDRCPFRIYIASLIHLVPLSDCLFRAVDVGLTGRKLGTRLKEHKTKVEATAKKPFTQSQQASSLSQQNKSALTDHASQKKT